MAQDTMYRKAGPGERCESSLDRGEGKRPRVVHCEGKPGHRFDHRARIGGKTKTARTLYWNSLATHTKAVRS